MWSAGVSGAVYVGCLALAVPRVGTATTIAFVVAGQLSMSVITDESGLLFQPANVDTQRVLGPLLVLGGAVALTLPETGANPELASPSGGSREGTSATVDNDSMSGHNRAP